MTEITDPQVVASYLAQLDRALEGIPEAVAAEIRAGVAEELAGLDAAAAAGRIESLGDPEFIAAEARAAAGVEPGVGVVARSESRGFVILTGLAFMVGGIVVPIVGWFVALVLLWVSRAWRRWEKWVATLAVPVAVALWVAVPLLMEGDAAAGGQAPVSGGFSPPTEFVPSFYTIVWTAFYVPVVVNLLVGLWLLWRGLRQPKPSRRSA